MGAVEQVGLAGREDLGGEELGDAGGVSGAGLGGPAQGVPDGAQALDQKPAGLLASRASQQLAGRRDARGALGEELAQAAAPSVEPAFWPAATTAARETSTSAVNAAGSDTAISARFLRSISTSASFRPCMNRL